MSTSRPPVRNEQRSFFNTVAAFVACGAFFLAMLALIGVAAGGGGNGGGSKGVVVGAPVHVTLSEFKIAPTTVTIPVGGKLHVQNTGTLTHNLQVKETGTKTTDIAVGGSAELDLSSLKAGSYNLLCLISGHTDSGMKATLVVSNSAAAADLAAASDTTGTHDAASTDGEQHDWAAMDQAMTDGMNTYLDSLKPGAAPLTKGQGNQKLIPTIAPDGTKEFALEASIIDWETEPGKTVKAWTYNGMVPAPWIRVEPGDKVRVKYTNHLPAGSDIHFHGITTPFAQDGVAPLTQPMVKPGETYTYEFTAPNHSELGMYHPHNHGEIAIPNGMFGVFQVGDVPLPAGRTVSGRAIPAGITPTQELPMVLNDAGVIGLTLNGKAFPATGAVVARPGEAVLVHYYNEGLQMHPMHLHHVPGLVVAKDGIPLDQPYYADTIAVAPGERYSVLLMPTAADIGAWAWHCRIVSHAESDKGLTGMVTAFVVADPNKPA